MTHLRQNSPMPRPDFEEIIKSLEGYAQNLKDNVRLGESKLVLAIKELVKVMGWSSTQADTNNIQVANLTDEIKELKGNLGVYAESARSESKTMLGLTWALGMVAVLQLLTGIVQIYLAKIQVTPILEQQYRAEKNLYEFCKEPSNWDVDDGGATPGSTCMESYTAYRNKFGEYEPAEQALRK
ncbi:MAG: hypothetical protein AAB605_04295 [Patescibacteria group bacterium]